MWQLNVVGGAGGGIILFSDGCLWESDECRAMRGGDFNTCGKGEHLLSGYVPCSTLGSVCVSLNGKCITRPNQTAYWFSFS